MGLTCPLPQLATLLWKRGSPQGADARQRTTRGWGSLLGMNLIFTQRDIAPDPLTASEFLPEDEQLQRVYRGVYLEMKGEDFAKLKPEVVHAARVFAARGSMTQGTVCGASAAILHGLPLLQSRIPEKVQLCRDWSDASGGWVRTRQMRLDDNDCVEVAGLPCTSLARTVRDLAGELSLPELLAVTDAALARGADLAPLATVRKHGRRLRWVLEHANERSESIGESWSRYIMITTGIDLPLQQATVLDQYGDFVARVDFAVPGLVGEFDGKTKYTDLVPVGESAGDVIMNEKHREKRMRGLGLEVTRWGWTDLRDPTGLARQWTQALARASRQPAPLARVALEPVRRVAPPDWTAMFTRLALPARHAVTATTASLVPELLVPALEP